jgi:hypothetical protein
VTPPILGGLNCSTAVPCSCAAAPAAAAAAAAYSVTPSRTRGTLALLLLFLNPHPFLHARMRKVGGQAALRGGIKISNLFHTLLRWGCCVLGRGCLRM